MLRLLAFHQRKASDFWLKARCGQRRPAKSFHFILCCRAVSVNIRSFLRTQTFMMVEGIMNSNA